MQRVTPTLTLAVVGDVGTCRSDAASMFAHVRAALRATDLGLCQLEPVLTRRGEPMPQARLAMRAPPESATAIRDAGFHVVSCAGNHCLDYGVVGMNDTMNALASAGLMPLGVGNDSESARQPVVLSSQGLRVGFLAYCSILPKGYEATETRPGCAPLRAWTHYEQVEHDQPGTPARVHTFANREDFTALRADIAAARIVADHVVVSIHWGVHFVPGELASYQREIAHAAVDAGASIVVGHHPHVLKAVEVYRGIPILYSLGNFALDPPTAFAENLRASKGFKEIRGLTSGWDEGNLLPPDTRLSLLVRCSFEQRRLQALELLPIFLNAACEPMLPARDSPEFLKVADYLDWTCTSQSLPIPYSRTGEVLRIEL